MKARLLSAALLCGFVATLGVPSEAMARGKAGKRKDAPPPAESSPDGGMTLGIGIGGGYGDVEYETANGRRSESGVLGIYSVRVNAFLGPVAIGARYIQDTEQREGPREKAIMGGLRFSGTPVSLLLGVGEIDNADDDVPDDLEVTSWEILIAPHRKPVQFAIHGARGDASYTAFSAVFVIGNR